MATHLQFSAPISGQSRSIPSCLLDLAAACMFSPILDRSRSRFSVLGSREAGYILRSIQGYLPVSIGVIIPALNAAPFIPALLAEIHQLHSEYRILVVDDGSSDRTGEVARAAGAEVIRHPVNRGKGAALDTGHHWALATGHEWVYTMDADGQHLPNEMQQFLTEAVKKQWDVVVGTRMADTSDMPWIREATNKFTSHVISLLAGCTIPDSQSGYRLFRTACLEGLKLRTKRYDTESEVLVRLAWKGHRIGSVPISTVYGEEKSSIRPLQDTGRFFRLVFWLSVDRFS